jgi:hypothetical protein
MIVWINGPFGVGKTETAKALHALVPGSFVYDPEQAGYFIWKNVPEPLSRKGDFQDLPMWRDMNYQMLRYIVQNQPGIVIVPMTIATRVSYDEIIGRLQAGGILVQHCILTCDRSTLLSRLAMQGNDENSWMVQQYDRCMAAFEGEIQGTVIRTDDLGIAEIVDRILGNMHLGED